MSQTKSSLTRFAVAWLVMWIFSYFAVAIMAPQIGNHPYPSLAYSTYGVLLLIGIVSTQVSHNVTINAIGKAILFLLAIVAVVSGVASWTGVMGWNVPFPNKEPFQVSMTIMDLISAVFMFVLTLGDQ